jgi:hypothetical protein
VVSRIEIQLAVQLLRDLMCGSVVFGAAWLVGAAFVGAAGCAGDCVEAAGCAEAVWIAALKAVANASTRSTFNDRAMRCNSLTP